MSRADGSIPCLIPCDICGAEKAEWWWGTSAASCGSEKCDGEHLRRYREGQEEERALEELAKEKEFGRS